MKSIVTSFLIIACSIGIAGDGQSGRAWLRPTPRTDKYDEWKELRDTDIYEVVASKQAAAIYFDLASKPCVALSEDRAKYFTGHWYACPRRKRPFLVRAVYVQGGTGKYLASRRGEDLCIAHGSLGSGGDYHQSALVVNLDFTPRQTYVEAAIAR